MLRVMAVLSEVFVMPPVMIKAMPCITKNYTSSQYGLKNKNKLHFFYQLKLGTIFFLQMKVTASLVDENFVNSKTLLPFRGFVVFKCIMGVFEHFR